MAKTESQTQRPSGMMEFGRILHQREFAALVGLLGIGAMFSLASPYFLTWQNISNIGRQASINGIAAIGMTFVIVSGGIDLSAGSIVGLAGTMAAATMVHFGLPPWMAVLVGIAVGALAGAINGAAITRLRIPPIIATLAMMSIGRGIALAYTGGYPVSGLLSEFAFLGRGYLGPFPVPMVVTVILYAVAHVMLSYTRFGTYVYGIGGNEEAARLAGIPVRKYKMWVYTLGGVAAAISGVLLAARLSSGQPLAGSGLELTAIAAVVIGGASVTGGEGTVVGTLIGTLIMTVLSNGLDLLNVGSFYQMIFTGAVLGAAVALRVRQTKQG